MRQTTSARCIATVQGLIDEPTETPISRSQQIQGNYFPLHEMLRKNAVGVGFGKLSYVKVDCAIPHLKGLCTQLPILLWLNEFSIIDNHMFKVSKNVKILGL